MSGCLFRFPYYSDKEENKRHAPDVTKAFVKYGISLTLDQDINESIESHQQRHFYTFYYRLKSWKSAVYYATTFVTLFFIGQ